MAYSPNKSELILYKSEFSEVIQEYLRDFIDTVRQLIETTESCMIEMTGIADELDKFHRGAIIASVTGSSLGIAGGITTIVGLALAPVTFGASLIVSAVGIGVAVTGGVTGAGASIADTVNIKQKSKRVQEMVDQINAQMKHLKEISGKITSEVKSIQCRFGRDKHPDLTRIAGRGALATVEITRMVGLSKITTVASRGAQLATRGVQAAAAVSGVLAALFILIDAFFIVTGAIDLHRGSRTQEAARMRECVKDLHQIYLELQEVDNLFCKDWSLLLNTE